MVRSPPTLAARADFSDRADVISGVGGDRGELLVVQAAADEVLDDGVGIAGGWPGDGDLAGADAGDGPVGDAGTGVVAGGGLGYQGDAVAVGDRGQEPVGLAGDVPDAGRVALAFGGGQVVVAPHAGFLG